MQAGIYSCQLKSKKIACRIWVFCGRFTDPEEDWFPWDGLDQFLEAADLTVTHIWT